MIFFFTGCMGSEEKNINFLPVSCNPIGKSYDISNNISTQSRLNDIASMVNSNITPIDKLYSMNETYFREEQTILMDTRSQTSTPNNYNY